MSSRYSPYNIRDVRERRRRFQLQLLTELNRRPVTPLVALCSVCLETYVMQSNDITEFLTSSNCTHTFCFKCVINLHRNSMNVPHATINCPMCNVIITTWQSFSPETTLSCKIIKKTGDRVPACQQFTNAVCLIEERCGAANEEEVACDEKTIDAVTNLKTQLKYAQNETEKLQAQLKIAKKETENLRKTLKIQKRAHDEAWNSSCEQVTALQNKLTDMQLQLDTSEALSDTLKRHNCAANVKIENLQRTMQQLKAATQHLCVNVEFNENARQNTNLYERFRSYVYSTVADMMIEYKIKSLQNHVFGETCLPCNVNVVIDFPFDQYDD